MKKGINLVGAAVLFAAFLAFPGGTAGTQEFKSFQLVYHSDTRGYYRPCG